MQILCTALLVLSLGPMGRSDARLAPGSTGTTNYHSEIIIWPIQQSYAVLGTILRSTACPGSMDLTMYSAHMYARGKSPTKATLPDWHWR